MADRKRNANRSSSRATQSQTQSQDESRTVEARAKGVERDKEQSKTAKAAARGRDERKEPAKRRETKSSSTMQNVRKNKYVRFVLEAYYELRHKVTWPTFEEARNMTVVVIVLSVVIGIILGIADFGLLHLYQLIAGK